MRTLVAALAISVTASAASAAPRKAPSPVPAPELLQRSYSAPCIFGETTLIRDGDVVRDPIIADTVATVARMVAPHGGIAIGAPGSLVVTAPASVLARVDAALAAFNENACRQVVIDFRAYDMDAGNAAVAAALGVKPNDLANAFVMRGKPALSSLVNGSGVRQVMYAGVITMNNRIAPVSATTQVGDVTTGITAGFIPRLMDNGSIALRITLNRTTDSFNYMTDQSAALKDGDTLVWTGLAAGTTMLYAATVREMPTR